VNSRQQNGGPSAAPLIRVEPVDLEELEASRNLLQSAFWGRFRERLGWSPRGFRCSDGRGSFLLLVLVRSLPGGLRLAYVGHGPELPEPAGEREGLLLDLARALKPYLPRCLFVRFDLPWGREGEGNMPVLLKEGNRLHRAGMEIQPPSTVVVDIDLPDADLLGAMKPKTRYNVRLAEKRDVSVREGTAADLPAWYALYRETARRDRITLHAQGYYATLLEMARSGGESAPALTLLLAEHEGELLAGIIVALRGDRATYLYGASADRKRNLMPSYGLQWQAMRLARERGCRSYDLFGIPPRDDPAHPMHGLYRFKTGFGGTILNRLGCYDVAFHPGGYRIYRAAEALRSFYYRRWRKGLGMRGDRGERGAHGAR
jgi:lipid II:glycine glycyltransferase (peptidoglycan interpeptide bridge formation enzyme)